MIKRNVFIVFFIALIGCLIHTNTASAAPKLEVKAEAGISNKVKYFTPLPLKLTITNNGSAFSGDLVIDAAESYAVGSGLVYSLDIAEGETKTVQLYLNGLSDDYMYSGNQQKNLFYFYEGGIEEGELIKFSGDKIVRPQFHEPEATFIYALTENRDRLTVLQRMRPFSNMNVEAFYLNQIKDFEFPDNKKGLEVANVLAIDETNITDFSEKQQQAILEWVRQGGKLLIGASDQVESSVGIFKEYLPLALSQERVSVSQSSLEKLSNNGKFTQGIEVYKASEKEGSIRLLAEGDTVLASATKLDQGQIIQTTFSLGDEPLATMDGYAKLLSSILKLQTPMQNNYGGMYYGNYNDYLPYEVGGVNELFPSFEVSTTMLVVIIVIYILFIGPLLYFILKRADKREHAWWIIPVVSIGLSVAMFIFGAKDRLTQSQIQQSAFYKVEDNRLSGHYVETILTNRNGDFSFAIDENTTAVATRNRNYYMGSPSQEAIHEKSYVKEHANSSTITLKNLNYWSVQSIVGQTKIDNAGNMDIQLKVTNGKVTGTIKNNFPFKLNDVSIWSGSREIELGEIEPNGTLEVSKDIKGAVLLSPSMGNYNYSQPMTKADLMPFRIEKLKYGAGSLVQGERLPAITAWTEEALVGIELDGSAENSPISYIIQTFEPDLELSGEFTLDKDALNETIEPTSNSGYTELMNEATNEWFLDKGDYGYISWIPEELLEKSTWTEISVSNKAAIPIELAIWNMKTQQFEAISEKSASITTNLEHYISEDGQVKLQITVNDNSNGGPIKLPDVKIKGVAK
ncbi:hypothetical protein SAMN05880501_11919 [Ureibacillus xyleni]|uniref:Uncharacterized protein n=1 Tax=Ureibacillus xyleni TaxID=614648 RepID=A0A285TQX0_9BACL|nr:hypothetical protein [Ureibacillus xyleni]SOC25673.1 hypothetical protein SAMN05880501_11919 [Ureibacillus xyleni]